MAAREWGIPPWEVENGPLAWFNRWAAEQNIRAQIAGEETFDDED